MGISYSEAKPYGLTEEEMTYALIKNPYFLPGRLGTYIAIGSVGEPFYELSTDKTIRYIAAFAKYLHNPIQFSTKSFITEEIARRLASIKGSPLSPLVTIITLEKSKKLEPKAPSPQERFEGIRNLKKAGLYPLLFLRPIIPGVNDVEAAEIMKEAKRNGAVGVVIGGFRVTGAILLRLKKVGIDISKLKSRLRGNAKDRKQVSIELSDIKNTLIDEAKRVGIVPFLTACCGNTYTAYLSDGKRVPCAGLDFIDGKFCTRCPVECKNIKTKIEIDEVKRSLDVFLKVKVKKIEVDDHTMKVFSNEKKTIRILRKTAVRSIIETAYRKRVLTIYE